jgi:mono/diheme cytochrome c family protein
MKHKVLLFCATLCIGISLHAQEERGPAPPEGEGKELFTTVCSQCHTLKSTLIMRNGQKGWEETVNRMVLYGAQLSPSEADRVVHYLTTQLGPGSPTVADAAAPSRAERANRTATITLPEGAGKELVATRCSLCHSLEKVVSATRTRADWEITTVDMQRRGMNATPDQMQAMISYLQAHFSTAAQASPQARTQSPHIGPGTATTGQEIFTQKCFQCHSVLPDQVRFGPSLYAEMRKPRPKLAETQIRTILKDGKGKMPPAKDLSKEDVDNLLAYIRSL